MSKMVVQMLYWTVGWASNRLKCVRSPGIEYEVVNSDLKLTFRHVTLNHNGTYSCHLDGYGSTHIETCDFQIQDVTLVEKVDQTNNTLAIVLGLLASNFLLVVGIVSLRGKIQVSRLLFRQSNKNPVGEKSCPMPTLQDYVAVDEKT